MLPQTDGEDPERLLEVSVFVEPGEEVRYESTDIVRRRS